MRAILRAGLRRDLHSIYTYPALLISLLCGLVSLPMFWQFGIEQGRNFYLDTSVMIGSLVIGIAVSAALRLLRSALEHESGMSRNKLIGGASKGELLLAEIILSAGTAAVQCCLTVCPLLYGALLYVRYFEMKQAVSMFFVYLCSYLFFAVLMTLVGYYAPSSAAIVVTGCVLFVGIGMGGLILKPKLSEPQYFIEETDVVRDEKGNIISHREEHYRNPRALHGPLRSFCLGVDTLNPLLPPIDSVSLFEQYQWTSDSIRLDAESRKFEQRTLYYRPAALFGMTLLLFAGGILFAPKKNFN